MPQQRVLMLAERVAAALVEHERQGEAAGRGGVRLVDHISQDLERDCLLLARSRRSCAQRLHGCTMLASVPQARVDKYSSCTEIRSRSYVRADELLHSAYLDCAVLLFTAEIEPLALQ